MQGRTSVCALLADLKSCASSRDLRRGKCIHDAAVQSANDSNAYVANSLINMYAKCGSMSNAHRIFDTLQHRNVVSWTTLILGYAESGQGLRALDLFSRMLTEGCEPNSRTVVAALKSCADLADNQLVKVKDLHSLACKRGLDSNIYVQGTLVDMYAKSGSMQDAQRVFDGMKHRNAVSWNALIFGYVENGNNLVALDLFSRMRPECSPDARTFVAALKSCAGGDLLTGKKLHLLTITSGLEMDIYVQSTLMDMYAKCGSIAVTQRVFDSMKEWNVVSWNVLITGYVENGEHERALDIFSSMSLQGFTPNSRTVLAGLNACTELAVNEGTIDDLVKVSSLQRGRALHLFASSFGYDADIFVLHTLVDMYGKCGSMEDAQGVFNTVTQLSVVCWTALILGYADNGEGLRALSLFMRMKQEGFAPNEITFVAALKACIDLAAEECGPLVKAASMAKGKALHMLAMKSEYSWDMRVEGTLVDMYAKCGSIGDAQRVFDNIKHPDVVPWTALILGYADNGQGALALDLFQRMRREGCTPNARTFAAALKAAGTIGAFEFGKAIHAEVCKAGLKIDKFLANGLVDIYAKCGKLVEAEQLFHSQETRDLVTWNTLMAGFSRHGHSRSVFDIFDRMCDAGLQPNDISFLCVLSACSHEGLVEKGMEYLKSMPSKYRLRPSVEHYNCMLDSLGRANKLEEAMELLRSMTSCPDGIAWVTVLGACRKCKNVELGRLAFESLIHADDKHATAYVQMATIYENPGREQD